MEHIDQSNVNGETKFIAGPEVTAIRFKNKVGSHNVMTVGTSGLTIEKKFSDGGTRDYIKFQPGEYKIPIQGSEGADGVDIYDGGLLKNRASLPEANYELVSETKSVVILKEYY